MLYTKQMPVIERASSPADRERIIELLTESLGLSEVVVELDPGYLQWKYWTRHPLFGGDRKVRDPIPEDLWIWRQHTADSRIDCRDRHRGV